MGKGIARIKAAVTVAPREQGSMKKRLTAEDRSQLLDLLGQRFARHVERHRGLDWALVRAKLEDNEDALLSLAAMEASGGEPDVIGRDGGTGPILFCDCSEQTPPGRRSLCYDAAALASRRANKPASSALAMAAAMGVDLLDEAQYRALQALGEFDTKTSSWLQTPTEVRERGGALFGDRRYDRVFIYHNGAESYYAVRGFRGVLKV